MSKKKNTTTTTRTRTSTWSWAKVIELSAYISIACIAIALLLSAIFGSKTIASAFHSVGEAIAYVVAIVVAGLWVKRKTHIAWLICYIVFTVAIIVLYIVNIVL